MEYDENRRDSPDSPGPEDAAPPSDSSQSELSPADSIPPAAADDAARGAEDEHQAGSAPEADASAPSEFESWPSQDSPVPASETPEPPSPTWSTEPPAADRAGEAAWPTEPPAAGSADAQTWPTESPERGDEPLHEPEWSESAQPVSAAEPAPTSTGMPESDATEAVPSEPPPSEVEAYQAPPATGSETAGDAAMVGAAAAAAAAHTVPAAESATGESTQCPRCGTENRPGLAFCRNCGQRLIAAGVASTLERPGTPEGTMACPRCGTHNRAGVAFCQNCGANLRATAPGYVPPAAATDAGAAPVPATRGGAVLGPVVLLIGLAGIVTGYLLPFLYGSGSLFERASGPDGYGVAFWSAYPEVGAQLSDQVYYGLTGPIPLLGLLLLLLAAAGFVRAAPGRVQALGLGIALLWSVGLIIMFVVVELAANWSGDLVGVLRVLTPAGIIFFLSSLIILIGTLTRFARS